jgi:hypothetical protein
MKRLLLALAVVMVPAASPRAADLDDLSWMIGHWSTDALGGTVEEAWLPAAGNAMHGIFRLTVDGEMSFAEFIQITLEDDSILMRFRHFRPDYTTWEDPGLAMELRLDSVRDGHAVFVAINDQTPDRIVYALDGDTLRVEVTGVPPFRFARVE